MDEKLRNERVGITHAARVLGVSVTELKTAVQMGHPLSSGHSPPKPLARGQGASGTQMSFYLGDVMGVADKIRR